MEYLNSLLFDAAQQGDFTVINQLIQMGADCAAKSNLGIGVMHLCLQNTSGKIHYNKHKKRMHKHLYEAKADSFPDLSHRHIVNVV